jgi:hypothetical protein
LEQEPPKDLGLNGTRTTLELKSMFRKKLKIDEFFRLVQKVFYQNDLSRRTIEKPLLSKNKTTTKINMKAFVT